MVLFFFYNKLTNKELIDKISTNYKIIDGSVLVQDYNQSNNKIMVSDSKNNNKIIQGKLVEFNMSLSDIIQKINLIDECKSDEINKKYIVETIQATCTNNKIHNPYIIY